MSSSIYCIRYYRFFAVYLVLKIFYSNIFYFEINFTIKWLPNFTLLFSLVSKNWTITIHQQKCFVRHPVDLRKHSTNKDKFQVKVKTSFKIKNQLVNPINQIWFWKKKMSQKYICTFRFPVELATLPVSKTIPWKK